MNLKQKAKTYSFWISLVSAILIIVRVVCQQLNLIINESLIMDVVTGICGVLVLLGILAAPTKKDDNMNEQNDTQNNNNLLNETIKQDIKTETLSIAQQIELLTKKSVNQGALGDEEMQSQDAAQTLETPIFVQEHDLPVDEAELEIKEDSKQMEDATSLQKLQNDTENLQNTVVFSEIVDETCEIAHEENLSANLQTADNNAESIQESMVVETYSEEFETNKNEPEFTEEVQNNKDNLLRNITVAELKQLLTEIFSRL